MNSDKSDHIHFKKRGAKTFRRGKALAFLERLKLKRSTIQQQLEQPEFQSIQQILVGELKAIDMMMEEFKQLFELVETETHNKKGCEQNEEN
ncbi:hypothetical protein [Gracilibacillus thailandensis]|uniref:2-keto-3-deoxygluconate kinase n=1 Tax=Gracilibacillus thailandensis TaxID=563735 RepID=A0A6N7QSE1_9BACI|nr:hypothetical protein [Gracilibacillus thailandensis]MRI65027.1 hypothetical protein [Gracilibacillus thailandensis]